jgi:hypothetical protein
VIQIHKWYPFVFPKEYDIRAIAAEKRAERLEFEYKQAVKAEKVCDAIDAYAIELYDKRARQHTIELSMFKNRIDKLV